MNKQHIARSLVVAAALAGIGMGVASAQDRLKTQDQLKTQDKDMLKDRDMDKDQDRFRDQDRLYIYGYELMTPAELDAHRARMRAANTIQERDRIRAEHRVQMDARAKERGVNVMHREGGAMNRGSATGAGSPGAGSAGTGAGTGAGSSRAGGTNGSGAGSAGSGNQK